MNKINSFNNQVNFNGVNKNTKSEPNYVQKENQKYSDELKAQGLDCLARAKQVLVKPHSSAPKVDYIQDTVYKEKARLEKNFNRINTKEFEEKTITDPKTGIRCYKNSEGKPHISWSGVVQNDINTITEYQDGKPVTVVKTEDTGKQTNIRLIKYEYPDGSLAAIKTETAILRDYNNNGDSLKVPKQIQDEGNG